MKKLSILILIILISILPIFAEEESFQVLRSEISEDSFTKEESFQVLRSEISEDSLITAEDKISKTNNISQFFQNIGDDSLELLRSEKFKNAVTIYFVGMGLSTFVAIVSPPLGIFTMAAFKAALIKNSIICTTASLAFFVRYTIKDFLKANKAKVCVEISDNEVIFINDLLLKEGNLVIYDKPHPIVFEYQGKIIETDSDGYIESIKSSLFIEAEGF